MIRLTLALAALITGASVAPASLAPRKVDPRPAHVIPTARSPRLLQRAPTDATRPGAAPELHVTEQTEILLDGKACRYDEVPARATILRLELATDRKTVLRIYFRTDK
jgi:hypothetical protein